MMNKILSIIKTLLILFFITFTISITIYSLVIIFGYDSKDSSQWISFLGSIIGGAFTLIGVLWTIKHEEKMRMLENRPILFINPDISFDLDENNKILNLKIKISNSGKGVAYSIDVEPVEETIIRDKNSFIDYLPSGKEIESCFLFKYEKTFDLSNFSNFPHEFKISFDSFYKCNDSLDIYINPFADELFNKYKEIFKKHSV